MASFESPGDVCFHRNRVYDLPKSFGRLRSAVRRQLNDEYLDQGKKIMPSRITHIEFLGIKKIYNGSNHHVFRAYAKGCFVRDLGTFSSKAEFDVYMTRYTLNVKYGLSEGCLDRLYKNFVSDSRERLSFEDHLRC